MPIRMQARRDESVEQLMRRFKKLCEREGLTKEIKRRMYYEKPSERRQRALRKSIKRSQMQELAVAKEPTQGNTRRTNMPASSGKRQGR